MHTDEELLGFMSDLGNGLVLLAILAGRIYAPLPREATLKVFEAFEAAYGPMAELQAVGRIETGGGILTPETGERVRRLGALLRLPSGSTEAMDAVAEIFGLAEQCLQALAPDALLASAA